MRVSISANEVACTASRNLCLLILRRLATCAHLLKQLGQSKPLARSESTGILHVCFCIASLCHRSMCVTSHNGRGRPRPLWTQSPDVPGPEQSLHYLCPLICKDPLALTSASRLKAPKGIQATLQTPTGSRTPVLLAERTAATPHGLRTSTLGSRQATACYPACTAGGDIILHAAQMVQVSMATATSYL